MTGSIATRLPAIRSCRVHHKPRLAGYAGRGEVAELAVSHVAGEHAGSLGSRELIAVLALGATA